MTVVPGVEGAGTVRIEPVSPFIPTELDSDYESARERMLLATIGRGTEWTDFNAPDPGTTAMEAAAFAIADMHYRVASADFSAWPAAWPGWLGESERHWSGALPAPGGSGELTAVAQALGAVLGVVGRDLEREVAACGDRAQAEALLAESAFAGLAPAAIRPAVVSALRWRSLRRVALELTDMIADAVEAADKTSSDPAASDALAATEVMLGTGMWAEECEALVRRERRRRLRETLTTPLVSDEPESLEAEGGVTKVWPPHPIQTLTCEPVTAEDYATRARTHPQVQRAWTVRGRLQGIAWNGLPTPTATQAGAMPAADPRRFLVPDAAAEAVTIVVETGALNPGDGTLRKILAHAVGTEAFNPYNTWRDDLDPNDPRRLMCDEVGIAPLRIFLVKVMATLLIPPTANRAQVTAAATAAVDAFLEQGRAWESAAASVDVPGVPLDGPWPPAPQPLAGWTPGESIRLSEVVARVVAIPEVIAVRDLRMGPADGDDDDWVQGANGVLAVPVGHVPRRSVYDCFTTEFLLDGGCDA